MSTNTGTAPARHRAGGAKKVVRREDDFHPRAGRPAPSGPAAERRFPKRRRSHAGPRSTRHSLFKLLAFRPHDESARLANPVDGGPNRVAQRLILPGHVQQRHGERGPAERPRRATPWRAELIAGEPFAGEPFVGDPSMEAIPFQLHVLRCYPPVPVGSGGWVGKVRPAPVCVKVRSISIAGIRAGSAAKKAAAFAVGEIWHNLPVNWGGGAAHLASAESAAKPQAERWPLAGTRFVPQFLISPPPDP